MSTDVTTLYKLMILYVLGKIDFQLSNAQISEFFLDKGYTNYFTLQESINELIDTGLIRSERIRNTSFYEITCDGLETLDAFSHTISDGIKSDIDQFLKERKYQLRNENQVTADYFKENENSYIARCKLMDRRDTLLQIDIGVSSVEEAVIVCDNWDKHHGEIYTHLMHELMLRK